MKIFSLQLNRVSLKLRKATSTFFMGDDFDSNFGKLKGTIIPQINAIWTTILLKK